MRLVPIPRLRLLPASRPGARTARTGHPALPAATLAAGLFAFALCLAASATSARAESPKGDVEYGAWLAGECVTCHQPSGDFDGIPPIVGWPEDSFVLIMKTYQDGARDHDVMRTIANRYNDEDLWALAAYFASLGSGAAQ